MDDERLKNPQNIFGKDYFEEQLERIRDIRSSERRFYQKITDIFALAEQEFEKYRILQDKLLESDFDHVVKKIGSQENKIPETKSILAKTPKPE